MPKDDLIYVFWKYNEQETYPELQPIVDAKIPFVVSSSVLNWCKIYPDIDGAERTNLALIKYGFKQGAKGQIVFSWGDNGNENFRENNHFGFCVMPLLFRGTSEGFDSGRIRYGFCNCAYGHYTRN